MKKIALLTTLTLFGLLSVCAQNKKTPEKIVLSQGKWPVEKDTIMYFWFSEKMNQMRQIDGSPSLYINGKQFTIMQSSLNNGVEMNDIHLVFTWHKGDPKTILKIENNEDGMIKPTFIATGNF